MINDLQLAQLLQSQYNGEDIFDFQATVAGVTFAVKRYPDFTVLAYEGTHNMPDVVADFDADMIYPMEINGTHGVHHGFWTGIVESMKCACMYLSKDLPLIITGHSLGAGMVNLVTAYLKTLGYTKMSRVKFAAPRSNDSELEDFISEFPCRSYWNHKSILECDYVALVPRRIVPFFAYFTDEPKIEFFEESDPGDAWGLLRYHHLFLYIRALTKIFAG